MAASKTITSSSSTATAADQGSTQLFEYVQKHIDERVLVLEKNLQGTIGKLIEAQRKEAEDKIREQAEKIRDQVLTVLALFAAFFTIISSGSLSLIRSPTPASILVVIASISIVLLVFLSFFFVFLKDRLPSWRVLWLPFLFFVAFLIVLLFSTSSYWSGRAPKSTEPTVSPSHS